MYGGSHSSTLDALLNVTLSRRSECIPALFKWRRRITISNLSLTLTFYAIQAALSDSKDIMKGVFMLSQTIRCCSMGQNHSSRPHRFHDTVSSLMLSVRLKLQIVLMDVPNNVLTDKILTPELLTPRHIQPLSVILWVSCRLLSLTHRHLCPPFPSISLWLDSRNFCLWR